MRTIIISDYYNALYKNGKLNHQGKPDYLDGETLSTIYPKAEMYGVSYDIYDELVGDRYPERLEDFPLERCVKYR